MWRRISRLVLIVGEHVGEVKYVENSPHDRRGISNDEAASGTVELFAGLDERTDAGDSEERDSGAVEEDVATWVGDDGIQRLDERGTRRDVDLPRETEFFSSWRHRERCKRTASSRPCLEGRCRAAIRHDAAR